MSNTNYQKSIPSNELENLLEIFKEKIDSVSFSFIIPNEIEAIPEFISGARLIEWSYDDYFCGNEQDDLNAQTFQFSLTKKTKPKIEAWVKSEGKVVFWAFWDKWGDPLFYWNPNSKTLYRYYWLGKNSG
jgi:hypothetical protein